VLSSIRKKKGGEDEEEEKGKKYRKMKDKKSYTQFIVFLVQV
jgi:hypothetical protein